MLMANSKPCAAAAKPHQQRSEAADGAAEIEQHVLRGGARLGRIELAHQRAIAAEHAVDEEAHHHAGEQ